MNEEQNNIGVSLADLAVDADNDPLDRVGINIEVIEGGCGREGCDCDSHFLATILNMSTRDAAMVTTLVLDELLATLDEDAGGDDYDNEE